MKPLLLVLLCVVGGASCAAPPASPGRSPVAWRLVEEPSAGGPELVLESYDPTGSVRISIRFAQERAAVGEVVEAEVRLPEAAGADGLFIEVHEDPDKGPSDGPNMLKLADLPALLRDVVAIRTALTPSRGR